MCILRRFVLSVVTPLVLFCSSIGCKSTTNHSPLYVTDDGGTTFFDSKTEQFGFKPEKIEEARNLPECQPSERDPDGHWGIPVEGFQMSIRLKDYDCFLGELISGRVFVRNISRGVLQYAVPIPDQFMIIEMKKEGIQLKSRDSVSTEDSFLSRVTKTIKGGHVRTLRPFSQHEFEIQLTDFYDLSMPGRYSVRVGRRIPDSHANVNRECMSAWAEFEIKKR